MPVKKVSAKQKPQKTRKQQGSSAKTKNGEAVSPEDISTIESAQELERRRQDRRAVLGHALKFRHFIESSLEPTITDCEIVVCFADIRGFTKYVRSLQKEMQDRKIQNFLRTYFKIYAEGLMDWFVTYREGGMAEDPILAEIEQFIVPTMYKNLGDGLMIVWEIPATLNLEEQGRLTQHIVFLVELISARFYSYFRDLPPVLIDAFSKEVLSLEVGFGIAKGHAWRLDFGQAVDYAGSIINLASRLQDRARPRGIVCQYDVSNWIFDTLVGQGHGCLAKLDSLKGYGGDVVVWATPEVSTDQDGMVVLSKNPNKATVNAKPRATDRVDG